MSAVLPLAHEARETGRDDAPPIVAVDRVTKRFAGDVVAVDDVSLAIRPNEFFALLGPSGCGKTTLLRMIAGFEGVTEGRLAIDGRDMARVPPNRRPVNMVFQSYAVFPHMSVADNVAYGLKVTGMPRAEIGPRVKEALDQVRLGDYGDRRPDQLSGGQRQRVALARALIKRPKVLLLDEPLSALDKKLREEMQLELIRLQNEVGITFIIVTHDQDEALSMANRIAVMKDGRIEQIAGPEEVYERPASVFVADFLGTINLLPAERRGAEAGGVAVETPDFGRVVVPRDQAAEGGTTLAVRPEKLWAGTGAPPERRVCAEGTLEQIVYYGDYSRYHVRLKSGEFVLCYVHYSHIAGDADEPRAGGPVTVGFDPADSLLLRG